VSSGQARKEQARQEKLHRKASKETPVMEFEFGPGLSFHGPIINTTLTITEEHREALNRAGLPVPAPVICRFLIDTGADVCVVKHQFAQDAGLKLINASAPLHGVGIDTTGRMYMGRIAFACASRIPGIQHQFAVDTQVQSGDLQAGLIDGVIGRNVLQSFEMIYNGLTGKVVMKFIGHVSAKRFPPGTTI
jgi:hypothetical protein